VSCGRRDGTDAALDHLAEAARSLGARQVMRDLAAGWLTRAGATCPDADVRAIHAAVRAIGRRPGSAPEVLDVLDVLGQVVAGLRGADDVAVLVAAALSAGHRARFRCASTRPGQPPHHVWTLVGIRCAGCNGSGKELDARGAGGPCDCEGGTRWVASDPLYQDEAGAELAPEQRHDERVTEVE
jgi:hypothetical protein